MRIRKKVSKPSAKRPPLYFIGYRGTAPLLNELRVWYDCEYGGPLKVRIEPDAPESWHAIHGPWTAHVVIPLPATHAEGLKDTFAWEHDLIGAVAPSVMPPREMPDTIVFAARLARGLTLLAQGTAFDPVTQQYLNPSDWQDRPLTHFVMPDHIAVAQGDDEPGNRSWCYTLGLSKFGIDELETFFSRGLPDTYARELLGEAVCELLRSTHILKVGSQLRLTLLGQTVTIVNYRTATPAGRTLGFREIRAVS